MGVVVLLPLALPPLMSGIVLIYLVGPYTFLGRLFGGHLTDSLTGIVLAQTFVAAPFLIVAASAAFGRRLGAAGHGRHPRALRHVALSARGAPAGGAGHQGGHAAGLAARLRRIRCRGHPGL